MREQRNDPKRLKDILQAIDTIFEYVGDRGMKEFLADKRSYHAVIYNIMIIGEANYSNAHGTPWVYKYKKMGSIVGMPVPGTMSSVTWETLQDPSLYFGLPVPEK